MFHYCTFCFLINIVIYWLIAYVLLRYFKGKSYEYGLPLGHYLYSITGHLMWQSEIQADSGKDSMWYTRIQQPLKCCHLHALLILTSIVQGVVNLKWFSCMCAYLWFHWVTHWIGLTEFSLFLQQNKGVYIVNS